MSELKTRREGLNFTYVYMHNLTQREGQIKKKQEIKRSKKQLNLYNMIGGALAMCLAFTNGLCTLPLKIQELIYVSVLVHIQKLVMKSSMLNVNSGLGLQK